MILSTNTPADEIEMLERAKAMLLEADPLDYTGSMPRRQALATHAAAYVALAAELRARRTTHD